MQLVVYISPICIMKYTQFIHGVIKLLSEKLLHLQVPIQEPLSHN